MSLDHVRTGPAFDAGPSDGNGADGGVGEEEAGPRPRRRRRKVLVGATGVAVMAAVAAVAAVVVLLGEDDGGTGATSTDGTTSVPVEVRDLVISDTLSGELGFGDANPVHAGRDGVVTGVAAVGTTVGQGGVLFHLDLEPTVLLHGAIPAFREMSVGVHGGSDVLQLEQALLALGYGNGVTVDGEFTSATASAVTAWETAPTASSRSRPASLPTAGLR
jgi:membrane fusion protein, multidrug efflux system